MGGFWKDDNEVYNWSRVIADNLAGLANWEGVAYGKQSVDALRIMLYENARDFLGLDPQKILDEWDRMAKAARDVCVDVSEVVTVELGAAKDGVRGWHGAGADAFRLQVDGIRAFTGTQYEFMVETIRALGAMLRVAVQSREDFAALAQATKQQIDKVIKDDNEKRTQFVLKVGNGIVKTVIGALGDPKKALFALAENVMDVAVETVTLTMEGGKLGDIVTEYVRHRDRLLHGYETELNEVAGILERRQSEYLGTQSSIFEPLPVDLDVRSPGFRYQAFMSKGMDSARFGPIVEREREKFATERHNLGNPDRSDPAAHGRRELTYARILGGDHTDGTDSRLHRIGGATSGQFRCEYPESVNTAGLEIVGHGKTCGKPV